MCGTFSIKSEFEQHLEDQQCDQENELFKIHERLCELENFKENAEERIAKLEEEIKNLHVKN